MKTSLLLAALNAALLLPSTAATVIAAEDQVTASLVSQDPMANLTVQPEIIAGPDAMTLIQELGSRGSQRFEAGFSAYVFGENPDLEPGEGAFGFEPGFSAAVFGGEDDFGDGEGEGDGEVGSFGFEPGFSAAVFGEPGFGEPGDFPEEGSFGFEPGFSAPGIGQDINNVPEPSTLGLALLAALPLALRRRR